jgi:hypothetical protein
MSGGFGGGGFGGLPWGGQQTSQGGSVVNQFTSPIYPAPLRVRFGDIKPSQFSGEPQTGSLSGSNGLLFFSPSLLINSAGNEIDIDSIDVGALAADLYAPIVQQNSRNFRFSRTGFPRTNNFLYRVQPKAYTAVGIMTPVPSGPSVVLQVM